MRRCSLSLDPQLYALLDQLGRLDRDHVPQVSILLSTNYFARQFGRQRRQPTLESPQCCIPMFFLPPCTSGRLAQPVRAPALQARSSVPNRPFRSAIYQSFQQPGESALRSTDNPNGCFRCGFDTVLIRQESRGAALCTLWRALSQEPITSIGEVVVMFPTAQHFHTAAPQIAPSLLLTARWSHGFCYYDRVLLGCI